ncbi:E3 ubiquitin-protein ligase ZNRF2-like [Anopheles albimanus]|uniref:E3 ubiquitin-protein ligase ZNRF1 n=1 Tax=Anopheles albimanus TaxID=7167 RepID=A0A182FM83_ANOAL|nr:E3 ubiquitin-protein ligase ZNRF2-like [Anopheles albimanus]XP_035791823.1 E3 ubiquitin-protein ligase ZNRF2-like [Anopheles albimanus]XP_035791832.1 E3 ubiquitin-protein ligase ZNRF2-like [Anopheles albimanus]
MGIKASTANGGQQSPRARTFSTSSSSEVVSGATGAPYEISSASTDPEPEENATNAAPSAASLALGRVYATSLPTHIWSLNGIKCPVCSKFVMPDDIECHLVMCLTKPRLSYNEDCLADAKGECVICLEDLSPGDIIARLPCLCIYHKGCIDKWFEVNRSCPEHPGD